MDLPSLSPRGATSTRGIFYGILSGEKSRYVSRIDEEPRQTKDEGPARTGDVIDVRIDALAPGGDAVGRQEGGPHGGRATFVALAAPGERVTARLGRAKARVAWGELVAIVQPSPVRVAPPCPYFGRCGGCQWQHVTLEAQRAAKRAIVERALGAERAPVAALETPVPAGTPYRDRARVSVGPAGELGFRARRDHRIVDVERCLLLTPPAAAALAAVRRAARGWPAGTEIDLQAGNDGVHVSVRVGPASATSPPRRLAAASALEAWRDAGVVGVRVDQDVAGAADVDVSEPGGPPLRVPAGGFAQVGRTANAALVRVVRDRLPPEPGRIVELYAGSGNFTRHLVATGATVEASDGDRGAVERGRRNVPAARWSVGPPRPEAVNAGTVVVDPPRAGLDDGHLRAALGARRRLLYVSCDPQTLARDARRLQREGFVLTEVVALDLMAHTFHVEVVATFDRP